LVYDARDAEEIGIIPLGKGPKLVSARDFYDQLCRDAEHERKLKKRNQLSGLHKSVEYIFFIEDFRFFFLQIFNFITKSKRFSLFIRSRSLCYISSAINQC
jgi:hypothetical protein